MADRIAKYVCMACCFSSWRSCLSSFTALLRAALSCGDLVFCHRLRSFLFSMIFCFIGRAHVFVCEGERGGGNEYRKHSSSNRVTTSETSVWIILCERHMHILQSCPSYREVFRCSFLMYSVCLKVYQRYAEVLYSS